MPFYRFSAASTLPDDGYSVIAPYVGTGRWILLRNNVGVQSIAQLQAIPAQERAPNTAVYVAAANAWYTFKSAAATLPTDIAPTAGTGSWSLNTAIVEVIPPYQKVFDVDAAISPATRIDFVLLQTLTVPVTQAISPATRINFSIPPVQSFAVKSAIAPATRIGLGFALSVNLKSAIAPATQIGFNITTSTATWRNLPTADWLNTATADWLNMTP